MNWLQQLQIHFYHADLLEMTGVEALACPMFADLTAYGSISRQILDPTCRPRLLQELLSLKASAPHPYMDLGHAVTIPCKEEYVLGGYRWLILVSMWDHCSPYTDNLFYRAYMGIFRAAFETGATSLALPIMAYDGNLPMSVRALCRVVQDLDKLNGATGYSLKDVWFVSIRPAHVDSFRGQVEMLLCNRLPLRRPRCRP